MNLTKEKHALQIVINEAEISALGDNDKVVLKAVEITKANARLIAAAPEMYEMLKELESGIHLARARKGSKTIDKLREVLAKVEGGEG